jgi:hypothetical protein
VQTGRWWCNSIGQRFVAIAILAFSIGVGTGLLETTGSPLIVRLAVRGNYYRNIALTLGGIGALAALCEIYCPGSHCMRLLNVGDHHPPVSVGVPPCQQIPRSSLGIIDYGSGWGRNYFFSDGRDCDHLGLRIARMVPLLCCVMQPKSETRGERKIGDICRP